MERYAARAPASGGGENGAPFSHRHEETGPVGNAGEPGICPRSAGSTPQGPTLFKGFTPGWPWCPLASVEALPQAEAPKALMEEAGFAVRYELLTFGVAAVHVGEKKAPGAARGPDSSLP